MRIALPIVLVLALANPAGASHCTTWSTSNPEFDTNPTGIGPRFYVDNDLCQGGSGEDTCLFSIWLYMESNGIPGLQRYDEVVDNTCHGMIAGDTIVI